MPLPSARLRRVAPTVGRRAGGGAGAAGPPPRRARHPPAPGTGSYFAERVVTNAEPSAALGEDVDPFVRGTLGIRERRWCAEGESAADLAERAARRALEDAGVGPGEVDLLIVSTDTPEYVSPATASVLHGRPGMPPDAGTFGRSAISERYRDRLEALYHDS